MIMDWFVLIFLVPLILVPIVLLCGFSGCGELLPPDPDTPTTPKKTDPANFTKATANGTDKIDLAWQHTSPTALFTVARTAPTPKVLLQSKPDLVVTDSGLDEGTDFFYTLTAQDGADDPSKASEASATTKPNAPTNLVALPEDVNHIVLTWNHVRTKSTKNITFKITDTPKTPPGSTTEIPTSATIDPTDPTRYTYSHTVVAGSEHEYRVTAVVDGFDNSKLSQVMSNPSDPASAIASWRTVYNHPLTLDDGGIFAGFTIVQRIDAAHITGVGSQSKVRVTLHGSTVATGANLVINKVTISQAAVAPEQEWNSIAPITQLRFGGASAVTIPKNTTKVSDKTNYTLVVGKDLIIAFEITAGPLGKLAPFTGPHMYSKNVTEAGTLTRAANYDKTRSNSVYIVEKIEVL